MYPRVDSDGQRTSKAKVWHATQLVRVRVRCDSEPSEDFLIGNYHCHSGSGERAAPNNTVRADIAKHAAEVVVRAAEEVDLPFIMGCDSNCWVSVFQPIVKALGFHDVVGPRARNSCRRDFVTCSGTLVAENQRDAYLFTNVMNDADHEGVVGPLRVYFPSGHNPPTTPVGALADTQGNNTSEASDAKRPRVGDPLERLAPRVAPAEEMATHVAVAATAMGTTDSVRGLLDQLESLPSKLATAIVETANYLGQASHADATRRDANAELSDSSDGEEAPPPPTGSATCSYDAPAATRSNVGKPADERPPDEQPTNEGKLRRMGLPCDSCWIKSALARRPPFYIGCGPCTLS